MKQRINITIEEELLDALREIVKYKDTNISQCVSDMILSSNEMSQYELQKLMERDGDLCSCCCKKLDLKGNHDDAIPHTIKADVSVDGLFGDKQLICAECYDKKINEKFSSIQDHFELLKEKQKFLESLKNKKHQIDREIDGELDDFDENEMYNRPTEIDMVWFNGWMQNIRREVKRGIVPFSDEEKLLKIDFIHDRPVIYDDENPIENSYIEDDVMYPIVINCCVDECHHDIIDTFSECYGDIDECGVEAYVAINGVNNEPYIYVRFRDSTYEYNIYNDGDWDMSY